jgi:hypothetical protein
VIHRDSPVERSRADQGDRAESGRRRRLDHRLYTVNAEVFFTNEGAGVNKVATTTPNSLSQTGVRPLGSYWGGAARASTCGPAI